MRYYFLEWVNPFEIMMLNSLAQDYPVMKINRIMRRYKSINALMPGTLLKKWHKRFHCAVKLSAIKPMILRFATATAFSIPGLCCQHAVQKSFNPARFGCGLNTQAPPPGSTQRRRRLYRNGSPGI
jgi:hypothetical protein